ncbi:hypothetical protein [Fortiea contorta]|uniref:hypothetical protein n=1 Tax=Fortiea contorta TaxID=1892405 RepID=UPI000349C833|nr:hypothetical protein [Fortiea contorta]
MTANSLKPYQEHQDIFKCNSQQLNLQIAQERLYNFLVEIVQTCSPEEVLQEFKHLIIDFINSENIHKNLKKQASFYVTNEQEFQHTIKRCCYIIINNWESKRNYKYIQELLYTLAKYQFWLKTSNPQVNTYKIWLENFINSDDYAELKSFTHKYHQPIQKPNNNSHWANRYSSYLLVAQSFDTNRSKEQQEAAKKLSKQMKDKFKFELAMYIARSQSAASSATRYKNPSILGDYVLRLIKMIVVKKGVFSHENLANIFLKQTQNQPIQAFKNSIQKYLFYTIENQEYVETVKQQIADKLSEWRTEYDEENINKNLLLRICNRLIDYLTTENGQEPSQLFVVLLSQGNPLTLIIMLLKIILICKHARSHLELRIAHLINYYEQYPENECKWFIHFLEIFNITFAIYAENVEYNLIKMQADQPASYSQLNLDAYRVFSQIK